jgi:DNA-binding NarL/FixJ family response regulator
MLPGGRNCDNRGVTMPVSTDLIRVALVEDDSRIRASLISLFELAEGYRCVNAFASAEEALASAVADIADVVLMDINLPGRSGIECVAELKRRNPALLVIMLTVYEDADKIFAALRAGASGYLLKRTPPAELLEAIRDVLNGGSPMSSLIARKVVASFQDAGSARPAAAPPAAVPLPSLTPREREILDALAKGLLYKEIAERLGIGATTVRTHLRSIYDKLQVQTRTEAVVRYLGS